MTMFLDLKGSVSWQQAVNLFPKQAQAGGGHASDKEACPAGLRAGQAAEQFWVANLCRGLAIDLAGYLNLIAATLKP